jgi:MraZ protein
VEYGGATRSHRGAADRRRVDKGRWRAVFLGTHTPRLDEKGRLFLPAKFRDRLADGLVVTKGQERCLFVYPADEFERLATQMQQGPTSSKAVRDYLRVFLAGAHDESPDRQGRLTIPPPLRQYAGLTRDCTVIGAGNRVEVWDSAAWARYLEASEEAFAEQSEEVVPGLF